MSFKGGFISADQSHSGIIEGLSDDLLKLGNKIGALTSFVGIVRETSDSEEKRVVGMEVEHWEQKGESTMTEIAEELGEKFGLLGVRIYHVFGRLKLGDPIVFVVLASEHRKEAFEALDEAVHLYKTKSPVWKKEIYEDETDKWIFTGS